MVQAPITAERQPAHVPATKEELITELENAYGELQDCMAQLSEVLEKPELDRARLTTIRLKSLS